MTSRTLLTDLINEIAAVMEYIEPTEPLRPTDTVVVEQCPEDLKKVYTLQQKYGRELATQAMAAMIGLPPTQTVAQERVLEFKALLLNGLFWQLVSMQFPADKQVLIGIRKGWVLVNPAREETPLADFTNEVPAGQGIN